MNIPPRPKHFRNAVDELNHLSDALHDATTRSEVRDDALVARFRTLLESCGLDNGSIVLQEHWALLHEIEGDPEKAAFHRKRQVELIEELFALGGPVGPINNGYLAGALQSLADNLTILGLAEEAREARSRAEDLTF